jgi:hypothetical protein
MRSAAPPVRVEPVEVVQLDRDAANLWPERHRGSRGVRRGFQDSHAGELSEAVVPRLQRLAHGGLGVGDQQVQRVAQAVAVQPAGEPAGVADGDHPGQSRLVGHVTHRR